MILSRTLIKDHDQDPLMILNPSHIFLNANPSTLVEEALANEEGTLTDTGALMCDTGKFTGRSPKDRYIVKDEISQDHVWWGDINQEFCSDKFDQLYHKMLASLDNKKIYVRDAKASAHEDYQIKLRVINTMAWHNLFAYNMFVRPSQAELVDFDPEYTLINIPEFHANPTMDGTVNSNFVIINLKRKIILCGGTAYAGEMKKSIFSVLNFLLPVQDNVLPMHCSANVGKAGDTALFFGLSGTGKTTLSADPKRELVGDDEHGWSDHEVFNFEGGCYAKVIDLCPTKEPDIFGAIKYGSIVENTRFLKGTKKVDFSNVEVTQNTRTSYPIDYIKNIAQPSIGKTPKNIFFLTCDAFGVLPPISLLDKGQAMYHFISGYTAKVAGTEAGVKHPQMVFSACYGAPFLPLHPTKYAKMLGEKIENNELNIWLINTGWIKGAYGTGERISLKYTRAMIDAALEGSLVDGEFVTHPTFGLRTPTKVKGVPSEILKADKLWDDQTAYWKSCRKLARAFMQNFDQFIEFANEDMLAGGPLVIE